MQYLKPTFTLPASTGKVSQAEWDRIFGEHASQEGREKSLDANVLPKMRRIPAESSVS